MLNLSKWVQESGVERKDQQEMARKTSGKAKFGTLLRKEGLTRDGIKTKTGRLPKSNTPIKVLRERSKKKK